MDRYSDQSSRPTLRVPSRNTEENTAVVAEESPMLSRKARQSQENSKMRLPKKFFVSLVVLLLALVAVWWLFGRSAGLPSFIDTSKYQSVLLANNNAFYGKVKEMTADHVVLEDVFYIQQPTDAQDETAASKFELIKLGNEMHGPYDKMLINRSQVVYVENLKDDGKVAQTIKTYHSTPR